MSNKLIPFDAATFDPNFQEPYMYIPLRYIGKGGTKKYPLVFESTTNDGWEHLFTKEGVYYLDQAPSLFMEPIEPEGEEDVKKWAQRTDKANKGLSEKIAALEKERGKLKAEVTKWRGDQFRLQNENTGLEKIIRTLRIDLENWKKQYADLVEHIKKESPQILPRKAPPVTIPFSWEKYKEPGFTCQTRDGKEKNIEIALLKRSERIVAMTIGGPDIRFLDGRLRRDCETDFDLVLAPPAPVEEVKYGNVTHLYNSEEDARKETHYKGLTFQLTFHNNICISDEPIKP